MGPGDFLSKVKPGIAESGVSRESGLNGLSDNSGLAQEGPQSSLPEGPGFIMKLQEGTSVWV